MVSIMKLQLKYLKIYFMLTDEEYGQVLAAQIAGMNEYNEIIFYIEEQRKGREGQKGKNGQRERKQMMPEK